MIEADWFGSAAVWLAGSIMVLVATLVGGSLAAYINYLNRLDRADEEELYDMAQSGTLPEDYTKPK